jgi:hypothetical protein
MWYLGMLLGGVLGSFMTVIFLEMLRSLSKEKESGNVALESLK